MIKIQPKVVLPFIVLLIGAFGAAMIVKAKPQTERRKPPKLVPAVELMEVSQVTHRFHVEAQGVVEARTESALVSEVAGRVLRISDAFVEGGFFEDGEILLWLDDRDYRANAAQAKAEMAQAKLALDRESEEARVASEEWTRLNRDESPSDLVLRKPQLAHASATLAAAEARLQRALRDLDRTQVRASYAGRIREKFVDVGDVLQPGARAASVYAVDFAEVRLPLFDRDLSYLDLSLTRHSDSAKDIEVPNATVRGEFAGSEHLWRGSVHRMEGEIDARSRMVHVVVRVADPYGSAAEKSGVPLAVGMFVDVVIEGRSVDDVVVIPRRALLPGNQIGIVKAGVLELRQADILRATRSEVVLAGGIESGEMLLLTQLDILVDGMTVRAVAKDGAGE